MTFLSRRLGFVLGVPLLLASSMACSSSPADTPPPANPDAGGIDAGPLDAAPLDAAPLDAAPLDATPLDAVAQSDADASCIVTSQVCVTAEEALATLEFPADTSDGGGDGGLACPSVADFVACSMPGCPRFPTQSDNCSVPTKDLPSTNGKCCYVVEDSLACPGSCG
jgi:hypothetical protein